MLSVVGGDRQPFCKSCQPGDYGETAYDVTIRAEETLDSKELQKIGSGVPFKVEELGTLPRRVKVTFISLEYLTGWISLETKKEEPLVAVISKLNRSKWVDPVQLVSEYETGQEHELKQTVPADPEENVEGHEHSFNMLVGQSVEILQMGKKNILRAQVRNHEAEGWIWLIDKDGDFTLGPRGLHEAEGGFFGCPSNKPLLYAARDGNLDKLKELLNQGGWFTSPLDVNGTDHQGKTALHYAAAFGRPDCVLYLLSRQEVEVNLTDAFLRTPLHQAAKSCNSKIVLMLIKSGCNVNSRDNKGHVPLHQVAMVGKTNPEAYECAKYLLRNYAVPDMLDFGGLSGMDFASAHNDVQMQRILKECGAPSMDEMNATIRKGHAATLADSKAFANASGLPEDRVGVHSRAPGNMPSLAELNSQMGDAAPRQSSHIARKSAAVMKRSAALAAVDADDPVVTTQMHKEAEEQVKDAMHEKAYDTIQVINDEDDHWEGHMGEGGEDTDHEIELTPQERAEKELAKALKSDDLHQLQTAVCHAEAEGIDCSQAQERIKILVAGSKAESWWNQCLKESPDDYPKLQKAYEECRQARVDPKKMERMKKILSDLKPQYDVICKLDIATKPENLHTLEAVLVTAKNVIPDEKYQIYVQKNEEYKNISVACDNLKTLRDAWDIEGLKDLVERLTPQIAALDPVRKTLVKECGEILKIELPKIDARNKLTKALAENPEDSKFLSNLELAFSEAEKVIEKEDIFIQAKKVIEQEREKFRIKSSINDALERTKGFHKEQDEAILGKWRKELTVLLEEARQPHIGMSELEIAPLGLRIRRIHNAMEDIKGSIRIYFRSRPLSQNEIDQDAHSIFDFSDDCMTVRTTDPESGDEAKFQLDSCFVPGTQAQIFEEVKDLIQSVYDGYNVTIFAYGQTGAGKTWTMYGEPSGPNVGLTPRVLEEIFVLRDHSPQLNVSVIGSMIELYRSDFTDLISDLPKQQQAPIHIRVNKEGQVIVENVVERQCHSADDLTKMILDGFNNRKVSATLMNSNSSRSHLIVMVKIVAVNKDTNETIRGKIMLCDLAGSERVKKSGVEGDNLKEAVEINKSLTALGNVMEQLTTGAKQIGYRNHKLTSVMQDALGGTAKTLMFCNCSPASINFEETLMTLKWATRAKQITNDSGRKAAAKAEGKPKAKPKMRR